MKDNLLILDAAHGMDVPGKRSPDGVLRECAWSRQRCQSIMKKLSAIERKTDVAAPFQFIDLNFDFAAPFQYTENEPGLSKRVDAYNRLSISYKRTVMTSMHINAASDDSWVDGASGFELWTSKGQDRSDIAAKILYDELAVDFPDAKFRIDCKEDPDREENFTVIWGYVRSGNRIPARYDAVLTENLFQTNHSDVKKLLDPGWNDRLENAYIRAFIKIFQ